MLGFIALDRPDGKLSPIRFVDAEVVGTDWGAAELSKFVGCQAAIAIVESVADPSDRDSLVNSVARGLCMPDAPFARRAVVYLGDYLTGLSYKEPGLLVVVTCAWEFMSSIERAVPLQELTEVFLSQVQDWWSVKKPAVLILHTEHVEGAAAWYRDALRINEK